jgi:hypothetical protein
MRFALDPALDRGDSLLIPIGRGGRGSSMTG